MREIRIINGTYGHKPAGSKYIMPVRAGDPPIMVKADKAAGLVTKGIAAYVYEGKNVANKEVATANEPDNGVEPVDTPAEPEPPLKGELEALEIPEYNTDMKAAELREIMDDCGITFRVGMTKADMVKALDEYFEGDIEDSGDMPDLTVEDPVL